MSTLIAVRLDSRGAAADSDAVGWRWGSGEGCATVNVAGERDEVAAVTDAAVAVLPDTRVGSP
ncbi:MAG: hypothetical protein NVSMB55_07970 [Mycobacteriales bacterium]